MPKKANVKTAGRQKGKRASSRKKNADKRFEATEDGLYGEVIKYNGNTVDVTIPREGYKMVRCVMRKSVNKNLLHQCRGSSSVTSLWAFVQPGGTGDWRSGEIIFFCPTDKVPIEIRQKDNFDKSVIFDEDAITTDFRKKTTITEEGDDLDFDDI